MNIANIFNYLSIDVLPKRHLFQDERRFNLLPKNDRQEIAPIAHGFPWSVALIAKIFQNFEKSGL